MYGICTYIWLIFMVNVGKYTIQGWYGLHIYTFRNLANVKIHMSTFAYADMLIFIYVLHTHIYIYIRIDYLYACMCVLGRFHETPPDRRFVLES